MKKAIFVIVIGIIIYLSAYFVYEEARYKYTHINSDHSYAETMRTCDVFKTIGIIISAGGALWVIVLAIQGKKRLY